MMDAVAKPQNPCAPEPPALERPEGSAPAPRDEAVPDTGMRLPTSNPTPTPLH